MTTRQTLTYKDAGVDIDAGNELVQRIGSAVDATRRPGVLGGIGGFGGLFELDLGRWKNPVLVAGADGVGTKLRLAIETGRHDSVGIDLVAMCANDVLAQGAEPLFFLDYYATGKLNVDIAESVVRGIAEGCRRAGAALLGGETAEMPGMYQDEDYDLAGFCVGVVDRYAMIDGSRIMAGDHVLGLASSGPHSNGYSLIRRIVEKASLRLDDDWQETTLADALLAPTRIYVEPVLEIIRQLDVRGIAHVTGGGIPENLQRVLPESVDAVLQHDAWQVPEIFSWLQEQGGVAQDEMYRTFNCGLGMILVVPEEAVEPARELAHTHGETSFQLGEIVTGSGQVHIR